MLDQVLNLRVEERSSDVSLAYRAVLLFKLAAEELRRYCLLRTVGCSKLGFALAYGGSEVTGFRHFLIRDPRKLLTPARIREALRELLGIEVPLELVKGWLYGDISLRPVFRRTALEEALFYREAYEMALEMKEWSPEYIALELSSKLPIIVPPEDVREWLRGLQPREAPLKVCPELGYRVGVWRGDYNDKRGCLRVDDWEFAACFAKACRASSGYSRAYEPQLRGGYWHVYDNSRAMKELMRSGLWKVVATIFPVEFLRGLYDSDGSVSPRVSCSGEFEVPAGMLGPMLIPYAVTEEEARRLAVEYRYPLVEVDGKIKVFRHELREVRIELTKRDRETAMLAKRLLWELGLRAFVRRDSGLYRVGIAGWSSAATFAEVIDFRESRRRERLEILLRLRDYSHPVRYAVWYTLYEKRNGRWVRRKRDDGTRVVIKNWLKALDPDGGYVEEWLDALEVVEARGPSLPRPGSSPGASSSPNLNVEESPIPQEPVRVARASTAKAP